MKSKQLMEVRAACIVQQWPFMLSGCRLDLVWHVCVCLCVCAVAQFHMPVFVLKAALETTAADGGVCCFWSPGSLW
jgi:hypothetical protein